MRLIDAEALYKELDQLAERCEAQDRHLNAMDWRFVQTVLVSAPTVYVEDAIKEDEEAEKCLTTARESEKR